MENILDEQPKLKKIYPEKLIRGGTFLGGPLVAGYFIAENFKVFNQPEKMKRAWVFSILFTLALFGGLIFIPEARKIPNILLPFIYSTITYFIVQHFQGEKIESHITVGGPVYKWGRVIIVALIGTVVTILPFLGYTYYSSVTLNGTISTSTYGTMKNEISFDKTNISQNDINKIALSLRQTAFFDAHSKKYVFVKKEGNTFEISISCSNAVKNNQQAFDYFRQLRNAMQMKFPHNKIVFNLTVNRLDNIVKKIE